jgi:DNA-binding CsgD family transcriptional regulator
VLRITPAERHALRLLAQGKAIDDVAVALNVGRSTVESDLNELFARMGVSGIGAAVESAFRRGLLVTEQSERQAKEGQ